jgi:hypothetical protein
MLLSGYNPLPIVVGSIGLWSSPKGLKNGRGRDPLFKTLVLPTSIFNVNYHRTN